jgi:hypothetical protein
MRSSFSTMSRLSTWLLIAAASVYVLLACLHTTTRLLNEMIGMGLPLLFSPLLLSFASRRGQEFHSRPSLKSNSTNARFIAKAFGNSLQPTRIIPYYYRAQGHFDEADITITTLITGNRFQVFSRLVDTYRGTLIALERHLLEITHYHQVQFQPRFISRRLPQKIATLC